MYSPSNLPVLSLTDDDSDWAPILLPLLGSQMGVDLNLVSHLIAISTDAVIGVILRLTGNI